MAFKMNDTVQAAFSKEMREAQNYLNQEKFEKYWYHLERAHILGQRFVWPHVKVHCEMLWFAFKKRDIKEIFGQIIRIPGGFIGSLINKVPIGNPGGANVKATKSFPLPNDLAKVLEGNGY